MTFMITCVIHVNSRHLLSGTQPAPTKLFAFLFPFPIPKIWVSKSFFEKENTREKEKQKNTFKITFSNLDFIDHNSIPERTAEKTLILLLHDKI